MGPSMNRRIPFLLVAALPLGGCLGGAPAMPVQLPDASQPPPVVMAAPDLSMVVAPPPDLGVDPEPTRGGPDNTFEHHSGDDRDPLELLKQRLDEGPPLVATRLHSCQKIPYATLGALLASRGVDLKAVAKQGQPPTAGQIYAAGAGALGAPNYAARTREPTQQTTSGATKLMDLFIAAAPEIIKGMPGAKACAQGGVPATMFDANGECTAAGILCLTGALPTAPQVHLCSQMVKEFPTVDVGRQLTVAALLAAAHTCE